MSTISATPFCFLPAKETFLLLIRQPPDTVTNRQNFLMSWVLVMMTFLLSVAIPNIKDAIAITGATSNPFIGFIFPILFYVKLDPLPIRSKEKIVALAILTAVVISSIMGMYVYIF